MSDAYSWIEPTLDTIRRANWYRQVQVIEGMAGPVVRLSDGHEVVNFASNDYLGLAGHPAVVERAIAATREYGTGTTGSRLLSGHRALHDELERAIAQLKKTEDAIVFSSGYLANIGTITALMNHRDLILADEYNHASLKNGATLSKATVLTYPHGNVVALANCLAQHRANYRRCLIVTDGVFGMDGDVCALPEILGLADVHEAMVIIDEAHSAGVLGSAGAGSVEHFGLENRPLIQMGTLSKSFASLGGYVAGSALLIDFLRNRAPSWIYTTGLSPTDTAAALAAIEVLGREPHRLTRLRENVLYLTGELDRLLSNLSLVQRDRFKRLPTDSAIVCVQVKDTATVLALSEQLKKSGVLVSAVRPPTVPVSRLRMSVMATHTKEQIDRLIWAVAEGMARSFTGLA